MRTVRLWIPAFAALVAAGPAPAVEVPVGPRAIGMGGAFCSIADDATALFWNPAGLVRIGHQELTGSYADLFRTGIKDNFIAFVLPLSSDQVIAGDWYHSGFDDQELQFGEDRFDAAYAIRPHGLISAGIAGKYLQREIDLDGSTIRRGGGYGMDAGLLLGPWRRLRLGATCQNLLSTSVRYDEGGSAEVYPPQLRAGLSYQLPLGGTVAAQLDDRYHFGMEWAPVSLLALRGGLEGDRSGPDGPSWAAGAGVKVGVLRFDYALSEHPTLGSTHHFGVSLGFNFNPAQVRLEKVVARPVYASLHNAYAHEPFGTVRVRNLTRQPVPVTLRVQVPGAMSGPSEEEHVVRPSAVQEFPLVGVFDEDVIENTEDRQIRIQVELEYRSLRLPRTERRSTTGTLYGRGAIRWGEGVAPAAAFVTIRDPIVSSFAREAIREVAFMDQNRFGNKNISYAAAIFDALGALGVAYVPDPRNPFSNVSKDTEVIDTVQYPIETLQRRTGDCDDTTVLLASLLGSVGVRTQFVDAPGHLFLLVGTGLHERNRLGLGLGDSLYVADDGEVWIPVETTSLKQGFAEAWLDGAEEYADYDARGRITVVDVTDAQSRYAPAQPRIEGISNPSFEKRAFEPLLHRDIVTISGWRQAHLDARHRSLTQRTEPAPEARYEVAQVQLGTGKAAEARGRIIELLSRDPLRARAYNNVAVTYAAEGMLPPALSHLGTALAADSTDPGIWLNLGVVRYASGDSLGASPVLREGLRRSGGFAAACSLLGLPPGDVVRLGHGAGAASEGELARLNALLRGIRRFDPAASGVHGSEDKGTARTLPSTLFHEESGAQGSRPLQNFLYWKNR